MPNKTSSVLKNRLRFLFTINLQLFELKQSIIDSNFLTQLFGSVTDLYGFKQSVQ